MVIKKQWLNYHLYYAIKERLKNNKNNNTNRKEILILKNKQTRKSIKRKRIIKTMIDDDPQLINHRQEIHRY